MPIVNILFLLVIVGVLLYLFNKYVTMIDGTIKQIINVVVIILVVLWLLQVFGILGGLTSYRVG